MSELSLRGENLHVWRGERHVLRGLALDVASGQVLQVTGANGAGKTSLLRALCGLLHLEAGRITWGGRDVRADLSAFHGSLAYLGHEPPLKVDLTAGENIRYWVGLRRRVRPAEIADTLASVGVPGLADRFVRTLSAGQRRRVALAGVLLLAAPLWLLDEPTAHLDSGGQQLVGQLIEQHVRAGGLAVTAVHHEIAVSPERVRRLELARG
ncbi:MAG TPA: cytochrome c biogenesis heme-transporting ATPase CcmA [Steroidobacteraceae bacterium]|nr:cytochrome c biogenesis heme-transporting ATPase CcmA [Steroidobacteraceae bacterium]